MQTVLEAYICGYDNPGFRLCFSRHKMDITDYHGDPDQALRDMLKNIGFDEIINDKNKDHKNKDDENKDDENKDQVWAHSTSWRHESHKIILTYLVWTDIRHINTQNRQILEMNNAPAPVSKGCLAPRPARITQEDVLRHGLRHLSFLVHKGDPFVAQAAAKTGSVGFLKSFEPALAGKIQKGA